MYPKFILRKDITIKLPGVNRDIKIFSKGHVFEPNEDGKYLIETSGGRSIRTANDMTVLRDKNGDLMFDKIKQKWWIGRFIDRFL